MKTETIQHASVAGRIDGAVQRFCGCLKDMALAACYLAVAAFETLVRGKSADEQMRGDE